MEEHKLEQDRLSLENEPSEESQESKITLVQQQEHNPEFKEFIEVEDIKKGFRIRMGSSSINTDTLCCQAYWIVQNILNSPSSPQDNNGYCG